MRVLVTGASGFVGRALVAALAKSGHEVRAAVRRRNTVSFPSGVEIALHGDLATDVDWSPLVAGCEAIVHLAGIAHVGPEISAEIYGRVNHRATIELAKAADRAGVTRFVFVSSIRAQTGPVSDRVLTEADEPRPSDAYGRSKLAAEDFLRASNLRYTILRPVLIYGAGVKGNLAALARLAASPWPLPFGALTNRRSLVNRASLIDAVDVVLRNAATRRETYVVADRTPIAMSDLVAALRRGFGHAPHLVPVPSSLIGAALRLAGKGDLWNRLDGELIADPSKLISVGWKPTESTATAVEGLAAQMLMC
jgi:nucleoside-diphosphate-sugar epimerase